jgi:hypothetical protein
VNKAGGKVARSPSARSVLFDPFTLVGGEVVHHHYLSAFQARGENPLDVSLEDRRAVVAPSTASEEPIPSRVMLDSSVVLGPLLRGTEQCARSPLGAQAYNAESEVLVPISSTNTNRLGSSSFAIVTFQAHLKNSSRSSSPIVRFFERCPSAS